jgi:sulfate transport system permease protein
MSVIAPSRQIRRPRRPKVIPGFGLTLGYSLAYLGILVLLPLGTLFWKSSNLGWAKFWYVVSDPEVVAAMKLSFGTAFLAAVVNVVFGLLVAWVLARYTFPGKRLVDGIVDLPFALPTSVAGIALAAVYGSDSVVGGWLEAHGVKVVYTALGVVVALIFVGLPFVVRTVQPVIEELERESEEAAASLGAGRWQTFHRVILPTVAPAMLTGFALAFARGVGEYGSVIFISGNRPMHTEIAPVAIMSKLEEFNIPGATAIALVMLVFSFGMLLCVHLLQWWQQRARVIA